MICTRRSCNCCCCGCCCCCYCCCWCQGHWMRRRRSMYWKIAKKKFVIHKNKHIKATLCSRLLLTPSHQSPDSRRQLACRLILLLPLLLFAPEGDKIILQCWHILCLLNQPTERTESNRTELNWTRLSSTGPGLNRTLSGPPHSSLPRVPSKSEPQFVHASFD